MAKALLSILSLYWTHEGHELFGNDPVKISVFNSFVVLVFLDIESFEIVPIEFNCVFQSLQALHEGALVVTVALACISVMLKKRKVI